MPSDVPDSSPREPGGSVGEGDRRVRIEGLIGRGGMGAVYLGHQESLGRRVAVKMLPAEAGRDAAGIERFRREAQAMAQLQHPGIVQVYDFGQTADEGLLYYVMELVEGRALDELVEEGQRLSVDDALELTVQACEAVDFAHQYGVVHRDLKPANLMLSDDGAVKVADFGLARIAGVSDAMALTLSGTALGTTGYMAPEQLEGREVDHRADIYSLGVVLYQLLTGALPRGAYDDPSALNPDADEALDAIIQQAMVYEPEHRFQSAGEMASRLREVQAAGAQSTGEKQRAAAPAVAGEGASTRKRAPAAARPVKASHGSRAAVPVWVSVALIAGAVATLLVWPPGDGAEEDLSLGDVADIGERPEAEPDPQPLPAPAVSPPTVATDVPPGDPPDELLPIQDEAGFPLQPPPVMEGRLVIIPSEEGIDATQSAAGQLPADLGAIRQLAIGSFDLDPGSLKPKPGSWGVALLEDGTLRAWGWKKSRCTRPPAGLSDVVQVTASPFLGAALKSDGSVVVWGGHKRFVAVPPDLPRLKRIDVGWTTLAAITEDGEPVLLGPDTHLHVAGPVPAEAEDLVDIALSGDRVFGLRSDGRVIAWNKDGPEADEIAALDEVVAIDAGLGGHAAVTADGEVYVWKSNQSRLFEERFRDAQDILVNGATAVKTSEGWEVLWSKTSDQVFDHYAGISLLMVDHAFIYGIAKDASAITFSQPLEMDEDGLDLPELPPVPEVNFPLAPRGHPGRLVVDYGDATSSDTRTIPVPEELGLVRQIAKSDQHLVAVMADGTVGAWATENASGRATVPAGLREVVAVAAGDTHSVALKNDGTVMAWGDPRRTQVPPLSRVIAIAAEGERSAALTADGRVVTWGRPTAEAAEPIQPPSVRSIIAIDLKESHFFGLRSDGRLVQWGSGRSGLKQTGDDRYLAITTANNESRGFFALTDGGRVDHFSVYKENAVETLFEDPQVRHISGSMWVSVRKGHRWQPVWHNSGRDPKPGFDRVAHCTLMLSTEVCHFGVEPVVVSGIPTVDRALAEFADAYRSSHGGRVAAQRDEVRDDYLATIAGRRDTAKTAGDLDTVVVEQARLDALKSWDCPWPPSHPEGLEEPRRSAALVYRTRYREQRADRLAETHDLRARIEADMVAAIDALASEMTGFERGRLKARIDWEDILLALDHEIMTPTRQGLLP